MLTSRRAGLGPALFTIVALGILGGVAGCGSTGATCTSDSQCGAYRCSSSGRCHTNCGSSTSSSGFNSYCNPGYTCHSHPDPFVDGYWDHHCSAITNCDPYNPSVCGSGSYCDSATRRCAARTPCRTDADCANGFACTHSYGDYCAMSCTSTPGQADSSCREGYRCNASGTGCDRITTCDPATRYSCNERGTIGCNATTRTCEPEGACATHADCAGYLRCNAYDDRCYNHCTDRYQCVDGFECGGDSLCHRIATCDPTSSISCNAPDLTVACDPATRTCVALATCNNNLDCTGGYRCVAPRSGAPSRCLIACAYQTDCVDSHYCASDRTCKPKTPCMTNADCNGYRCELATGATMGYCGRSCDADANCVDTHYCNQNMCRARTRCTTNADCGAYRCTTEGGSTTAYCSVDCFSDSDCASTARCSSGFCIYR